MPLDEQCTDCCARTELSLNHSFSPAAAVAQQRSFLGETNQPPRGEPPCNVGTF
jgi:hypothetical protein